MKNPWISRNPFMSLWLSGANSVANKARMQATDEFRRQQVRLATQTAQQMTQFWTAALTPPALKTAAKALTPAVSRPKR